MESKKTLFTAEKLLIGILAVVAIFVTVLAVVPSYRQELRNYFGPEHRTILAKISGDLTGRGMRVTVLKIQTRENLVLEIYSEENPETSTIMAKIPLPEKRDAYFSLKGNATNLGLADIDDDGTLEILVPTFDEQMVARLNIYKFNVEARTFERVTAPPDTSF
ncbi:MAG: hypothetical protein H7326_04195 [Bdellovibrionaceae bacterium]|nr:hypothetical protein [Pseudobdellovibrionaceae bacterium]